MTGQERFMSEPGDPEPHRRMEALFNSVIDSLGYSPEQRAAFCSIRSRELAFEGENDDAAQRLTDDRLTELIVKGRTVAIALHVRDDLNYIQVMTVDFLTPELQQVLQ
jgi:hypothetical protein